MLACLFVISTRVLSSVSKSPDEGMSADDFFTGDGSPVAVHRLLAGKRVMKEREKEESISHVAIIDLKSFNKSGEKFGIAGRPRGVCILFYCITLHTLFCLRTICLFGTWN